MFNLLANLITVFRILLIFLLLPLMCYNQWYFVLAFQIIFLAAVITDYLDGYIARKYKQQTVFGKFFDPIADKLLVIITLFYISQFRFDNTSEIFIISKIFFPPILMVIVIREFLVTGIRLLAANNEIVVEASFLGKVKTCSIFLAIFCLFFGLYVPNLIEHKDIYKLFTYINKTGDIFLLLATFLTISSGVDYFFKNYKVISKNFSPKYIKN